MEICRLQVKPLGTTNFMPRCCMDLRTLTENQLFQLCRLAQGFKQIFCALCSFRVSVEAPAVFYYSQKQSVKSTLGLQQVKVPVSVNSDSYDNFPNLYSNSDNFQQRQINTRRQQESLQTFLSARHHAKLAFFKLSHLALRTFCHAAAGISGQ